MLKLHHIPHAVVALVISIQAFLAQAVSGYQQRCGSRLSDGNHANNTSKEKKKSIFSQQVYVSDESIRCSSAQSTTACQMRWFSNDLWDPQRKWLIQLELVMCGDSPESSTHLYLENNKRWFESVENSANIHSSKMSSIHPSSSIVLCIDLTFCLSYPNPSSSIVLCIESI